MSANQTFFGTIKNWAKQLVNGDGTGYVTLISAGASGSKVESISVVNSDAAVTTVVGLAIGIGGTDYPIGEVSIPLGAGSDGTTKAVDLLNVTSLPWIRSDGVNRYLYLGNGATLRAKAKVAVAGVNTITFIGQGGDA